MDTTLNLIFNFHKGAGSVNVFGASVQTGDFWAFVIGFLLVAICLSFLGILAFREKPIQIGKSELSLSKQSYILVSIIAIVMFSSFVFFRSTNAYATPNHIDPTIAESSYVVDAYVNEDTGEVTVDDWIVRDPDPSSEEPFISQILLCSVFPADGLEGVDANIEISYDKYEIYNGPFNSLFDPLVYIQTGDKISTKISFKDPEIAKSLIGKDQAISAVMQYRGEEEKPTPDTTYTVTCSLSDSVLTATGQTQLETLGWSVDSGEPPLYVSKEYRYQTPMNEIYNIFYSLIESKDLYSNDPNKPLFVEFYGYNPKYVFDDLSISPLWNIVNPQPGPVILYLAKNNEKEYKLTEKGKQVAKQYDWVYNENDKTLTKTSGLHLSDRICDIIKVWTPDTVTNVDPNVALYYWTFEGFPLQYYWTLSNVSDNAIELWAQSYTISEHEVSAKTNTNNEAADAGEAAVVAEAPAAEAVAADEAVAVDAGEAVDVLDKAAEAIAEIANVDIAEASGVLLSVIIFFLF